MAMAMSAVVNFIFYDTLQIVPVHMRHLSDMLSAKEVQMDNGNPERVYRLVLQQLNEGVILADPEGRITFVNDAAESIRNIRRDDILGQSILDCHQSPSRAKVSRAIDFLRNDPQKTFHRMVTDEVNKKFYENVYGSVFDESGEFLGMTVITRDITAQRRSDELRANDAHERELVLDSLQSQYHLLQMSSMEMLTNLLEARDVYTNGHSHRVAEISAKLYDFRYGVTGSYLDIQWAAKLHDIGKICIPDQIILKTGRLTPEEYDKVKLHRSIAADILKSLDPGERITPIIRHHHERYDGSGYPDGLSGQAIPLGSRIIAVADAYDAMTSNRPYRDPLDFASCIREIRANSGTQFDPEWVETFTELARTGSID